MVLSVGLVTWVLRLVSCGFGLEVCESWLWRFTSDLVLFLFFFCSECLGCVDTQESLACVDPLSEHSWYAPMGGGSHPGGLDCGF